jgi:hypothetical protein
MMRRPRLYIVVLACAGAFLGVLGLARASDNSPEAASAPQSIANTSASTHVTKLGHAATLPPMKTRRATRQASAPAASPPAPARAAPAQAAPAPPAASPPAASSPPSPPPKPTPKPSNPGTPFSDVD